MSQVSTSASIGEVMRWAQGYDWKATFRPPGAEGGDVSPHRTDRDARIPLAVDDQDAELATGLEPGERTEPAWNPAIDGDDSGEPFGVREAESIGDGRPFADADEEDPFGMDMESASRLADRGEDAFFEQVGGVERPLKASPNDLGFGGRWRGADVVFRSGRAKSGPQP